jgi:hypothetical protein
LQNSHLQLNEVLLEVELILPKLVLLLLREQITLLDLLYLLFALHLLLLLFSLIFFFFLSISVLSSLISTGKNLALIIKSVALGTSLLYEALELHLKHGNDFLETPILHHGAQNVSILLGEQSDKGLQEVEEGA